MQIPVFSHSANIVTNYFAANTWLAVNLFLKAPYLLDMCFLRTRHLSDGGGDILPDVHLSEGCCSFTIFRLTFSLYICISLFEVFTESSSFVSK